MLLLHLVPLARQLLAGFSPPWGGAEVAAPQVVRWGAPPAADEASRDCVVVVDPLCDYLGASAVRQVKAKGALAVGVFSTYLGQHYGVPALMRVPARGAEEAWARGLPGGAASVKGVLCATDAGLADAAALMSSLLLPPLGGQGASASEPRWQKHAMGEAVRRAGLRAPRAVLASQWTEEVEAFAREEIARKGAVILKPDRGSASGDVFKARTLEEARASFDRVVAAVRYADPARLGARNGACLVQELLQGAEYAVDTVSRRGEHKVVALWTYDKRPAAWGGDFVYHATALAPLTGPRERRIADYALAVLEALGVDDGPAHLEVIFQEEDDDDGEPALVELNARFHGQNFVAITNRCLGYDQIGVAVDALLDAEAWAAVPALPATKLATFGMIKALVAHSRGTFASLTAPAEAKLRGLSSFHELRLDLEPGDALERTVDLATSPGHVILLAETPDQLSKDLETIVDLEASLFFLVEPQGGEEAT